MIIFNIIFNRTFDILTFKYWIGKNELKSYIKDISRINILDVVMNSYSCVLNYNQIDYQAMLDEEKKKEKKYHESTMIRQIVYFLIFIIMFLW